MDNCWDYHDGGSEIRMGKALRGRLPREGLPDDQDRRPRRKKAAAEQIDESLKRLQTDVIDLLQLHEIIRLEDPDRIFAEGGAMEAVLAAQEGREDPLHRLHRSQGPARPPADAGGGARHGLHFDTVQMPLNVMDAHFRSFETKVLPVLVEADRRAGDEVDGRRRDPEEQAVDADRVPALRHEPADRW